MDAILEYNSNIPADEITVELPFSKSVVNRLAVMGRLAGFDNLIDRYSSCEDTDIILKALRTVGNKCNAGASGTALRFLLSYFALKGSEMTVSGTARLCQRPVGELAGKLTELGADIAFLQKDGFLPLVVQGGRLYGGEVCFENPAVSSQYISSLMLIAPYLKNGLTVGLPEGQVSTPYIGMTAQVMQAFGAKVRFEGRKIRIEEGEYIHNPEFKVPHDWSAASYWYETASLLPVRIRLKDMGGVMVSKDNMQGDSRITELYKTLGINTVTDGNDLLVYKDSGMQADALQVFEQDLSGCPDIVPSLVVSCLLNNRRFEFCGVGHLRLKESDRIESLIRECGKMGYILGWNENKSSIYWDGSTSVLDKSIIFETYNDHRITMSLAPAVFALRRFAIKDAGNVVKSYKTFWDDVQKTGISVICIK